MGDWERGGASKMAGDIGEFGTPAHLPLISEPPVDGPSAIFDFETAVFVFFFLRNMCRNHFSANLLLLLHTHMNM